MSDRYDVYGWVQDYGSDDCRPWNQFAERLEDERNVARMDLEEQRKETINDTRANAFGEVPKIESQTFGETRSRSGPSA